MKSEATRDLDEALTEGFFADRVVRTLTIVGPLDDESKETLRRAIRKLDLIHEGERSVRTGSIGFRVVNGIHAYSRAIELVLGEAKEREDVKSTPEAEFTKFLVVARGELEEALRTEKIAKDSVRSAVRFFESFRELTLRQSSTFFKERPAFPRRVL